MVAACAVLDPDTAARWGHVLRAARDSKLLVAGEAREALAAELKMILPAWAVAEVDNLGIDRENILEASLCAMRQAVAAVRGAARASCWWTATGPRARGLPERLVVDGDALSCAVACASILAKTHRDALMRDLDQRHPGYGFARHKGYGTPAHRRALRDPGRLRGAPPQLRSRWRPWRGPEPELRGALMAQTWRAAARWRNCRPGWRRPCGPPTAA